MPRKKPMYFATIVCVGLLAWKAIVAKQTSPTRIQLGPAVAVSSDQGATVEPFIATDPTDPRRLAVSASEIVPDHGIVPRVYLSDDGGSNWRRSILPEVQAAVEANRLRQGVDTWLSFDSHGTLYYSTLVLVRAPSANSPSGWGHDPTPQDDSWGRGSILVFRSDDHGKTFGDPVVIRARSFDAPKIVAGPNGEVIAAATISGSDPAVTNGSTARELIAVYRSDDGARSFRPVAFLGSDSLGRNPLSPVILPDSTVAVGWFDHPTFGSKGADQPIRVTRFLIAPAKDGQHFAVPDVAADTLRSGLPSVPRFVADTSNTSQFKGRSYLAWNGGESKHGDFSLSFSQDGISHWSPAVHLRATEGNAVLATAAVAADGTVGALWGEHETDPSFVRCWNLYFADSLDGGISFSQPQKITAARICPDTPANLAQHYPGWGGSDSVAEAWPHGGDYVGLAASTDAAFHAVWTDSRGGLFHAYTARITIGR